MRVSKYQPFGQLDASSWSKIENELCERESGEATRSECSLIPGKGNPLPTAQTNTSEEKNMSYIRKKINKLSYSFLKFIRNKIIDQKFRFFLCKSFLHCSISDCSTNLFFSFINTPLKSKHQFFFIYI